MKIPFSPPYINDAVKQEVLESLESGWITTGPKVKKLESQIQALTGAPQVLCVNSWTSGAMLICNWFGIKEGDEVIIPAYTYAATALAVIHAGGKPVLVDIQDDFNVSVHNISKAITPKTKIIMPVDIAGWPCDYDDLNTLAEKYRKIFVPDTPIQEKLGRILVVSDAAHSIGASYKGKQTGVLTDVTIFSLHAVKNITTAEGGAICLNLPTPFNNEELYATLRCYSLNGQTKDAFSKSKAGSWQYDIIYPGLKINMPDVLAAIGVGQMNNYGSETLPLRKKIFEFYNMAFENKDWALLPPFENRDKVSSCHLYALRIRGINELQRNQIINRIAEKEVAVNVHFQPLPLLTLFKELGFNINDFPQAYSNFENEISLPIYPQLSKEALEFITNVVIEAVENTL